MNRTLIRFLFTILAVAFAVSSAAAQQPEGTPPERQEQRPGDRMQLLRELGLSQDQIRQIRMLNVGIRERRQAAQEQLRQATRSLDQAIYADTIDEQLIRQRMAEVQAAQGEIAKINFENEFAVRKVLTPEQLVKFREFRRQAAEARERFQQRRQENIQERNTQRPNQRRPGADRPVQNTRPPSKND